MNKRIIIITSLTAMLFIACSKKKDIEFQPIQTHEAEEINPDVNEVTLEQPEAAFWGRGSTWELWRKMHKECMKTEFFDHPVYMGVSSTYNLGTVIHKSLRVVRTTINSSNFSDDELHKIIQSGSPSACSYKQELNIDFGTLLETSSIDNSIDADLSATLKNAEKTEAKIDSWHIDSINTGDFIDAINASDRSNTTAKEQYKKWLFEEGNKVLIRIAVIDGFTSTITLKTEMSAEVKVKLQEGVIQELGATNAQLRFKYVDDRTIEVKSLGKFVVFGDFMKAKRLPR